MYILGYIFSELTHFFGAATDQKGKRKMDQTTTSIGPGKKLKFGKGASKFRKHH